ncbi:hypothetical protein BH23ACT10_BH23ACT10_07110 [soil metagenome]
MSASTLWEQDEWTVPTPTLFASIARYRWIVAAVVVTAIAVGYLVSSLLPPSYEATTTIYLSEGSLFDDQTVDSTRRVQQEANRLEARSVFESAADNLGQGFNRERLTEQVEIDPEPATGLIDVVATAGNADTAAEIANAITRAYDQASRRAVSGRMATADDILSQQADDLSASVQELQDRVQRGQATAADERRLEAVEGQLIELQARISEMAAEAAMYGSGVADVETAVAPLEPSSPKPIRNAAFAGLLSLACASAVAYWRAGSAVRQRLDPSAVFGAPLLAQIPVFKRSAGGGRALFDVEAAEAYQFLLSSVEYAIARTGARSILITSPSPGDGKSLTALHLARGLAIQGNSVVLVDSDIRARGLTTLLNANDDPGLAELAQGSTLDKVIRQFRLSSSLALSVVPAGQTLDAPTGLLATTEYRKAMTDILDESEMTIIDAGPLLTVADPSAVAMQVDGIVLVLDAGTTEDSLLKVQSRLRLISTPLLGYVVNRVEDGGTSAHLYGRTEQSRVRRIVDGVKATRPDRADSDGREPTPAGGVTRS